VIIFTSKHTYCCSKMVQIINASSSEPRRAGKVKSGNGGAESVSTSQFNWSSICHIAISQGSEGTCRIGRPRCGSEQLCGTKDFGKFGRWRHSSSAQMGMKARDANVEIRDAEIRRIVQVDLKDL